MFKRLMAAATAFVTLAGAALPAAAWFGPFGPFGPFGLGCGFGFPFGPFGVFGPFGPFGCGFGCGFGFGFGFGFGGLGCW